MIEVTVSQEFISKAKVALSKSVFWEFADCPTTLRIAIRQAELDGRRVNNAARTAAKRMLKRVYDPQVIIHLQIIAKSKEPGYDLAKFEDFRDKLLTKVANEFSEAEKIRDVAEYRKQREERIAIATGLRTSKSFLTAMTA